MRFCCSIISAAKLFLFAVLPAWTSSRVNFAVVFALSAEIFASVAAAFAAFAADFISSNLLNMVVLMSLNSLMIEGASMVEGTSLVGTILLWRQMEL